MKLKVYGIYGKTAAIIQLPVNGGKAFLPLEFENGNVSNGEGYRPATYSTNDKAKQIIIENSDLFKVGEIKIIREYDEGGEEDPAEPVRKAEHIAEHESKTTEYPDVKTIEQARAVLKSLGAKATVLTKPEGMIDFMHKQGISFPNFNF